MLNFTHTKRIQVLDPNDVANAVVNQVLSCTGRQLLIGDISWLAGLRSWPHYLGQAIIHSTDGQLDLALQGKETSSVKS